MGEFSSSSCNLLYFTKSPGIILSPLERVASIHHPCGYRTCSLFLPPRGSPRCTRTFPPRWRGNCTGSTLSTQFLSRDTSPRSNRLRNLPRSYFPFFPHEHEVIPGEMNEFTVQKDGTIHVGNLPPFECVEGFTHVHREIRFTRFEPCIVYPHEITRFH